MPKHFPRMVAAELLKVLTRVSGWAGLGLSLLIPILVGLALWWMQPEAPDPAANVDMQAAMMQSMIPDQAYTVLDYTLTGRNLLILPMILLLVTAQLFAGEWSGRTLRSLLLRPVSRGSVLMAKFSALWIYSGACLLLSYLVALGLGWGLLGHDEAIRGVSMGYLLCWVSDAALIGLGMLVSTFAPSVAGVVVGTILTLIGERMINLGLKAAGAIWGVEWAEPVAKWMPSSAFDAWAGYEEAAWPMEPIYGLAVLLVVVTAGAIWRFSRLDVP